MRAYERACVFVSIQIASDLLFHTVYTVFYVLPVYFLVCMPLDLATFSQVNIDHHPTMVVRNIARVPLKPLSVHRQITLCPEYLTMH